MLLLITNYFNNLEKQVAYAQYQFWQGTKKCILPTAIDPPQGKIHRFVWVLEVEGFSRDATTIISKRFAKVGIIVYYHVW